MNKLKFIYSNPVWVSYNDGIEILKMFEQDPTLWLKYGISFEYLKVSFDSRNGKMLISSDRIENDYDIFIILEKGK